MNTASAIIGRRAERRALDDHRRRAIAGEPGAVLIVGDAGVGKSTLLSATRDDAVGDGWQVQVGHCVELAGGALPLGPITEILRRVVAQRGRDWLVEAAGPLGTALDPLVDAGSVSESSDRAGLLGALVAVVEALAAEEPLLLAVEDLHWADRSTLDALDLVVRTTSDVPVLAVFTIRGDELHRRHPTRVWAAELTRHPRAERIDLMPLGPDDLAALVARIDGTAPDRRLLHELYQRTDGNPFFVEALLASSPRERDGLPERLSEVLLTRLDALEPAARRVVDVTAAAGRGIDHRLVAAVAGLDETALRHGARQAIDAGLLVQAGSGSGYRMRHALLREVAHEELLPGDREQLHRALAEALEATPDLALSPAGPHGELAYHWQQARDQVRTYLASLAAAQEARSMAAYAESLEHTERALALYEVVPDEVRAAGPRRDRLLHDAGVAAYSIGLPGTSRLRAAADEARAVGAPVDDVLRSLLRLAFAEWVDQQADKAIAVAEEAVDLVDGVDTALLTRALGELARLHCVIGRPALARPLARRAVDLAAQVAAPVAESVARNSLALTLAADGHLDEAVDELRVALRLARDARDHIELARAATNLTEALVTAARVDEAERTLEEFATAVGNPEGLAGHIAMARLNVAVGLLDELRTEEAARYIDAVRLVSRHDDELILALHGRASLALHRGDIDAARALADKARTMLSRPLPNLQEAAPVVSVAAWAALLDGDAPSAFEACAWLIGHADAWAGSTLHPMWSLGVRAAVAVATTAAAAGDDAARDEAAAKAHEWAARDEEEAAGRTIATAERTAHRAATQAVLARLDGGADRAWMAALEGLHAVRGLWRAQVAVEAAADLRAAGRTGPSRTALDDAERHLGRLPASHPLARRARQIREAIDREAESLLTAREQEVIGLVAQGCTNREIGERLFISEKTASVHVSNIMRKLEAGNRLQATEAARRLGML